MIFNKDNKGTDELRTITGDYYASNKFDKISTDIELAAEELIKITGREVYEKAEEHYNHPKKEDGLTDKLVSHIRLPVALWATLQMYRKNDVGHNDDGRKIKIDPEHEKLPWEWQLKRDDEIHLDNYYKAVDRLVAFLDANSEGIPEWKNSPQRKTAHSLFLKNAEVFDNYFPIDKSGRLFVILLPFIKNAQRRFIKPALGEDYNRLLAGTGLSENDSDVLESACGALALMAFSLAIRRLPLGLIPSGVIRNYVSQSQTMNASQPATVSEVRALSEWLTDDAEEMLNEMKETRNGKIKTDLFPHNCIKNKYMIV
ncbi:MAG: hypothetical protein LBI65_01175 [Candidatus Symbiothrix sp.]|jgi:hypothetical protein|nr:hypothetical protein [Candidatus Symbiothrix sp.]